MKRGVFQLGTPVNAVRYVLRSGNGKYETNQNSRKNKVHQAKKALEGLQRKT